MFKKSLVIVSALFALSLVACGDDDGGTGTIDARPPGPDAPRPPDSAMPPMVDAGNMNPPAMGLGQVCPPACPTDFMCLTLDADQTDGLCANNCGQSNDPATAPAGGDAICSAAYTGTVGTTQCALRNPDMPPPIDWFCAVLCPMGQCPGGLLCDASGLCIN